MNVPPEELTDEQIQEGIESIFAGKADLLLAATFFLTITKIDRERPEPKSARECELMFYKDVWHSFSDPINKERFAQNIVASAIRNGPVWDNVCDFIAQALRAGESLPQVLLDFNADLLEGKIQRSGKGDKIRYASRDLSLCLAVEKLMDLYGLNPMRNDGSPARRSACDIVASAASKLLGYKITYDSVRKAWKRSEKALDIGFNMTPTEAFEQHFCNQPSAIKP